MGNRATKSNLYAAISAGDVASIVYILSEKPDFLNEPITDDSKSTALTRATYLRKHPIIQLLLERGADPNLTGTNGVSPLMWAGAKNDLKSIEILINSGARLEQTGPQEMNATDFAVLFGNYQTAYDLKQRGLNVTKSAEELLVIKKDWSTPYVDFSCFLLTLECNMPPEGVPLFTIPPPPKIEILHDPVSDPRETWKDWFKRVLEFEYAPKVERNSLPEKLQPQNTLIGRMKTLVGLENPPKEEEEMKSIVLTFDEGTVRDI